MNDVISKRFEASRKQQISAMKLAARAHQGKVIAPPAQHLAVSLWLTGALERIKRG